MLFTKVILAVAFLSVGLFFFNDMYGDHAVFSDAKPKLYKDSEKMGDFCLPHQAIGNKYFEINMPSGFCGCLNDGKKAIDDGKELGKEISEVDFVSMCFDVYYKQPIKTQCNSINAMLSRAGKNRKLNCSCFSQKINAIVSHGIVKDSLGRGRGFFDNKEISGDTFKNVQQSLSVDIILQRELLYISEGVVTSCVK